MSKSKRSIRDKFRWDVFVRDGGKCRVCGKPGVDAHHIVDRNEALGGGYFLGNGITLCAGCHVKAEEFHRTGVAVPGYSPDDLFDLIKGSNHG
jgi:5-methylcytosine-specific restriction endonuclease McrA